MAEKSAKHNKKPTTGATGTADASETASATTGGLPKHAAPPSSDTSGSLEKESVGARSGTGVGKTRSVLRRTLVALCGVVSLFAAFYLVGVIAFLFMLFPNTSVAGRDVSYFTNDQFFEVIDGFADNFSIHVSGKRMDLDISSDDAGISIDKNALISAIHESQNEFAWPVSFFEEYDWTDLISNFLSASNVGSLIESEASALNSDSAAVQPVDAYILFDEETSKYVIEPEVLGNIIDADAVAAKVSNAILDLDDEVELGDDVLLKPEVCADDENIVRACDSANSYVAANFDVMMQGVVVGEVTPVFLSQYVSISDDLSVTFNEDGLSQWTQEIAEGCNTVGATRTYTRPDGKNISVSGGTYGWVADSDGLFTAVMQAMEAGSKDPVSVPVLQSGASYSPGSVDWGLRYVDVDLTEQHARFYDSSGTLVWESNIVSGNANKYDTPTGVYYINSKGRDTYLRGPMVDGEYEWESFVTYWMPFLGNSYGLHDATWRSTFGGNVYNGNGSHGCVNLPYSSAEALFGLVSVGDPVIVHY